MSKHIQKERALARQKQFMDALVDLMLEEKYSDITVSMICQQAQIPRRMFYYYFDSKDDVFQHILMETLEQCDLEAMFCPGADREELMACFSRFFRYWRDQRERELNGILRCGMGEKMITHWVRWIAKYRDFSQFLDPLSEEKENTAVFLGITCVFYTLFYWQGCGFRYDPEQIAEHVTKLLTNPIYRIQ